MLSLEQLIFLTGTIVLAIILIYLFNFVWKLERKYDIKCFLIGDLIFMIFLLLLLFSPLEQVPSLLSSLFIAELTLALVWVELSKRPELKLLDFIPIIHDIQTARVYRADYNGTLSEPSEFLKIREASYKDLKFGEQFSFSVDLSNIGYGEIMVHQYLVYIDGKLRRTEPFKVSLITQERKPMIIPSLYINSHGFHRVDIKVLASTVKCSKEVWFFISEDFKKLRYVEMYPLKRLLSPLIKNELKL